MDDSERNRTLRMEIPGCEFFKQTEDPSWLPEQSYPNGWTPIGAYPLAIGWEGTIDLSGYARDYKTFYPSGGVIQEGAFWSEIAGDGLISYTLVSSTPVDLEETVFQIIAAGGPGFLDNGSYQIPNSQQNWTTVIFAESQLLVPNVNITPNARGFLQPLSKNQSGSLSPTAAQVLYVYKLVYPFGTAQTELIVPASRVILPGSMDQEPELEYMMRLSRSVELANQV
jgi:hypothetical protein